MKLSLFEQAITGKITNKEYMSKLKKILEEKYELKSDRAKHLKLTEYQYDVWCNGDSHELAQELSKNWSQESIDLYNEGSLRKILK